jgi:hypothetical protein
MFGGWIFKFIKPQLELVKFASSPMTNQSNKKEDPKLHHFGSEFFYLNPTSNLQA